VDAAGLVTSWSVTAARLFGQAAEEMTGQYLGDVLLNRPGQRELLHQALAEVGAGRTWTATVDLAFARADGLATMHCEPTPGGWPARPGGALVIIQRAPAAPAWPAPARPGPDLLSEAATRIGTTLDLTRTAREVTEVAVPAFAAAATIFVSEPLLAADDVAARRAGSAAVVRRLTARLAGQPAAVTDSVLRPGEVLVFDRASPSLRAMSTGQPVRSDHLGRDTVDRLTRRPGGHQIAASYTTFLAVPLTARGLVLGCANFARAPAIPASGPMTSRWPPSWPPGPRCASITPGSTTGSGGPRSPSSTACCPASRASRPGWRSRTATCRWGRAWWAATGMTSCRCLAGGRR
jgi:hypothetical protein